MRGRNESTHCLPIVQINCLPKRIIPGVESSPIDLKLIREDKVPVLRGVLKGGLSVCTLGRFRIDETKVERSQLGDLAGCICAAIVERTLF